VSKAVATSIIVTLIGVTLYAFINFGSSPPKTDKDYISVALDIFNATAIFSLFIILYTAEKQSVEKFGAAVRENISIVIVALLINLISTLAGILRHFS
jgi:hypothetical protein